MENRHFCVALTGGIGSGKSAVAARFGSRGVKVVDTDQIARSLTQVGGAALPAIRAAFGAEAIGPDGAMDRAYMRRLIFADALARRRLEAILHPMIRAEVERALHALQGALYAILVVPLLIETGAYRGLIDRTLVVDCAEMTQIQRVMARDGLGEPEIRAILAAQASREQRLAEADDVVQNEASLDVLDARIDELHERYSRLARDMQSDVA